MSENIKTKNDLALFMVHHALPKIGFAKLPQFINHIQSGCALAEQRFTELGDDVGDSISELNPYFGELTVHYWIWKNIKVPYVGFQHYRRLFNFSSRYQLEGPNQPVSSFFYKKITKTFLNTNNMNEALKKYDLIIPSPQTVLPDMALHYCNSHDHKDWQIFVKYLEKKLTVKYRQHLNEFVNSNELYACILYMTSFDIFSEMMSWLFDILFDLKEIIKISDDPYQIRTIAFLAERLLHLYYYEAIKSKRLKVQCRDYCLFIEQKPSLKDFVTIPLSS